MPAFVNKATSLPRSVHQSVIIGPCFFTNLPATQKPAFLKKRKIAATNKGLHASIEGLRSLPF